MDVEGRATPGAAAENLSNAKASERGALLLAYFLWSEQQEVGRHQAEPMLKNKKDLLFDWIPASTGMTKS